MTNIIFLCPHAAAKSVMASAYCRQMATEAGLDLTITAAGTEPDDVTAPAVANLLQSEGIDVTSHVPRRVTQEELNNADLIVSLGCNLDEFTPIQTTIEDWSDVPPPSQGLMEARDLIHTKVERLVDSLKSN